MNSETYCSDLVRGCSKLINHKRSVDHAIEYENSRQFPDPIKLRRLMTRKQGIRKDIDSMLKTLVAMYRL